MTLTLHFFTSIKILITFNVIKHLNPKRNGSKYRLTLSTETVLTFKMIYIPNGVFTCTPFVIKRYITRYYNRDRFLFPFFVTLDDGLRVRLKVLKHRDVVFRDTKMC